ncbi:MAG TPA: hypothetical protein VK849_11385 [Longimicrobiales bacterium]|nr:hypothetical protein [Longimicrobiales bacterium]
MQLLLTLVCDEAGLGPDGKLDVHGVFNDLYAPGFPAKQDRMVLVVVVEWDRSDEGRYRFRVDLEDQDGRPALSVDGYSDVDRRAEGRPPPRTRLIMPLEEVVFPRPGAYRFRIRIKGETFAGPSLYLVEAAEAPPAG